MKKALPNLAYFVNTKRFNRRIIPVSSIIILTAVLVNAVSSGGVSARPMWPSETIRGFAFDSNLFLQGEDFSEWDKSFELETATVSAAATSSLIVQIGFNPANQPENFTAGVSNPSSQPLRIQTQQANGLGETVTGAGWTVFVHITSSSPTGRFEIDPAGPFTSPTLTLTIRQNQQNTQNFFYRDPTPGTVVLTATVTNVANTGLTMNETASVTKSVLPVGVGRLTFGTHPSNTNKDSTITPPVAVRIEDALGNLDAASTRTVSLAIGTNPGGGVLGGTTTVPAVGGIATFNNLTINRAGSGYTLVASSASPSPALTAVTSAPFNVNKLGQTITFGPLENKTYGDPDFDVIATASSGGQVSFNSPTLDVCTISDNTVHIVSAGDCTIRASQSGDADNNAAPNVDQTFTVNKADATVVVSPYDVVYDSQTHSGLVVSIIGVNGETEDAVGTVDVSGTVHTNAGAYPNDEWIFIGTANYNDAFGTVDNSISKALVTATAGGGSSTYDGTAKVPSACEISGPGYVGDLSCSNDPTNVGPNANSYMINPSVTGTRLSNFDISTIAGTFTIGKAPSITTVTFEAMPYVYRGTAFAATARVTGAGGLDQAVALNYAGDCLNVFTTNGCTATSSYVESTNHLRSTGGTSITITKKALTVTGSSHTVTFGDPVPTISPMFDGFVSGETAAVIDAPPVCSTTYVAGSSVGQYPATCDGGSDNNYSFMAPYTAGTVTVNPACSAFNGFLSPIGGANAYPNTSGPGGSFLNPIRTFKMNSTIPFKFTSTCFGVPLITGIHTLSAQKYRNGLPDGNVISATEGGKTANRFRYTDGEWHLNFKTKDLGEGEQGTWLFEATLSDGRKYNVWLAIRK